MITRHSTSSLILSLGLTLIAAPALAASIDLSESNATAGGMTSVSATFHSDGSDVAGTQNDIHFDATALTPDNLDGKPNCEINAAINKAVDGDRKFSFGFLKGDQACNPASETCDGIRAIVVATDNVAPIPTDTVVYTCQFKVAAGAAKQSYALTVGNAIASDPSGQRLATFTTGDGAIVVGGATCCGDKNGDGSVSAAEATAGVLSFSREDLSLNPAADCNPANGTVSAAEATRAVLNFAREECN